MNESYFAPIQAEEYARFKQSIREDGILTPLRVSADMTIISGHQRYRAAQELGIKRIPVIVDETIKREDDIRRELIVSNFQRMKNEPLKEAAWIAEYERLRGVRQGSAGNADRHNAARATQTDIAKELGADVRTLQRKKKLLSLIPEFQEYVNQKRIKPTDASACIAGLDAVQQRRLYSALPEAEKHPRKLLRKYVAVIQNENVEGDELKKYLLLEKEIYDECISRGQNSQPVVSGEENERIKYESLFYGIIQDQISTVEYFAEYKWLLKGVDSESRKQYTWDAAHFAYNLSEILGELVEATGDELEAPADLIDLLADCSAVFGNLSTQLKNRTVKIA